MVDYHATPQQKARFNAMKRNFTRFAPRIGAFALVGAIALSVFTSTDVGAKVRFDDVSESHWAVDFIDYAVDKGYFSGTSSTTFSPEGSMTRAMLWTVLSRMDDATIPVVPGQPWYQGGRDWAMKNGISDGTNPDGNITREQFATMLRNFAKHTGAATNVDVSVLDKFVDRGSIASYAVDSMAWAVTQGIVSGTGGNTISPTGLATRSQAAAMLMRFDQMGESKPSEPSKPIEVNYKTTFAAINVPPYPGDTIEVGHAAYVTIASNPYGANVKAGVTYTVTSSDVSVATVSETQLSPDEVSFRVSGLKAGKVTLTAIGSDGFKGTTTITVKGGTEQEKPAVDTGMYSELKTEVVRLINQERTRVGLNPLSVSDKDMRAAEIREKECATWQYSHTRPNGTSYNTVFQDVGLASGGGEILNSGFMDARAEVDEWIASPGHYKTMTKENYNYIGVGVARGSDGYLYYCTIFCPIGE